MGQTKLVLIPNFCAPSAVLANIWATLVHTAVKVVLYAQVVISRFILVKRFVYHVHQDDLVVKMVWMNAQLVPVVDFRQLLEPENVSIVPKVAINRKTAPLRV